MNNDNNVKKVILHLGTPKTGSSSLQAFLLENASELYKNDIIYPLEVSSVLIAGNAKDFACPPTETTPWTFNKQAIENALGMSEKGKTLLLSSELLWLIEDKESLVRYFVDAGFKVQVIVYLRRQDEYLNSAISQNVKEGNRYWRVILDDLTENAPLRFNYYKELEKISSVIGRENVCVRVYEKNQIVSGSIIDDFMDYLDIELDKRFHVSAVPINLKASPNNLKLMDVCGSIPVVYETVVRTFFPQIASMSSYLKADYPETYFMPLEERKAFLSRYAESNRRLAIDYLKREDGRLFYNTEIKDNGVYFNDAKYTLDDAVRLFAYTACLQTEKNLKLQGDIHEIRQQQDKLSLQIAKINAALDEMEKRSILTITKMENELDLHRSELDTLRQQLLKAQETIDFLLRAKG